jgi:two-component system, OmpR family, response regulator
MRILLVEDHAELARAIRGALTAATYAVDVSTDGEDALHRMVRAAAAYDAVILDLGLPLLGGMEVLARARASGVTAPVLILTARSGIADRVRGLDSGADDYLVKPFATDELLARVRALVRRGKKGRASVLSLADLKLDPATCIATRGDERLDLTPKEVALLQYLLENAGSAVTRAMIAEHVWDESFDAYANVIDVHISHLRRKLERGGRSRLIHTVRAGGYLLAATPP